MSVTLRRLRSVCLVSLAVGAACAGAACGGDAGAARAPQVAPPTKREATDKAHETELAQLKAATTKTLKSGAKLDVPAGWWLREIASGVAFQDPDRELTITLLEIDADSTDQAIKTALARLGRTAPTKIARNVHEKDQAGWDEIAETVWETPPSEQRIFAINVRRKDKKAWATLLEGKTPAFSRRGAQIQQIVLGLEVPGVTEEERHRRGPLGQAGASPRGRPPRAARDVHRERS
jgi:hypothetical protein